MSSFCVPIVRIEKIGKHPNADNLSITQILGENVIFRTGDFKVDDFAVYIPEDAVVPEHVPGTEFLGTKRRIRAKRLRGIFSCGLLLPTSIVSAREPTYLGQDLSFKLNIKKYEEPFSPKFGGESEKDPGILPVYELENYRTFKHIFVYGEEVQVSEKLHGTNFRAVWHDDRLYVGSHRCIKRESEENLYWQAAKMENLAEKLKKYPGYVFYGEIFGQVQDLKYDTPNGQIKLNFFDIYDSEDRSWLDFKEMNEVLDDLGLKCVPYLYIGNYYPEVIEKLVEGQSKVASHNKEGIVIKTTKERWNSETNRCALKYVSEWYRTRHGGTEYH